MSKLSKLDYLHQKEDRLLKVKDRLFFILFGFAVWMSFWFGAGNVTAALYNQNHEVDLTTVMSFLWTAGFMLIGIIIAVKFMATRVVKLIHEQTVLEDEIQTLEKTAEIRRIRRGTRIS